MPYSLPPLSNRPLRIAVIGGRGVPSSYSGVERICEEMFGWFAQRGHKVTVYCRPHVLAEKMGVYKGIRLVRTPAPGGKTGETLSHSLFSILHAVARGDIHEKGERFDLISMHTIAPNLFAPIAAMAGIPIVSHVHGLDHLREKWKGLGSRVIGRAERTMVRTAKRIVGVNPSIQAYYRERFNLETELLPNGVHTTPDRAADPLLLRLSGLQAGKYFVSIGRIVPEKRLHDTIAAFAKVDTDYKLAFVGDAKHTPGYLAELKTLAEKDPKQRIVFTGQQSGEALESLFRGAHAYISASELEGNPSSVLECMERGTPAILSDIDGHRPLFSPVKEYDLSFAPGDVAALTARMQRALTEREHFREVADACRRHVRSAFSWPMLAERTEQLYRDVVHGTIAVREQLALKAA